MLAGVTPLAAIAEDTPPEPKPTPPRGIIVIDAGHQAKPNTGKSPTGPGAKTKSIKVASGAKGVATKTPEYKLNLIVSKQLQTALEAAGYKVIMIRTTNNVNISNDQRAIIGNKAKADLVIHVHANSSTSPRTKGYMTLVPKKNKWTGPIVAKSKKLGKAIHREILQTTKAKDQGVIPRADLKAFNYSTVPSIFLEMGFMSNPAEDRKMGTAAYQAKIVKGTVKGINKCFKPIAPPVPEQTP